MRIFVRGFLVVAVTFGLLTAAVDLASGELGPSTAIRAVAVGVVLALLLLGMHAQATRGTDQTHGSRYERRAEVPLAMAEARRRLLSAVPRLRARLEETGDDRRLRFQTRMSWKSFGEVIDIRLEPLSATSTGVEIKSRARIRTTVVDYGKNHENVELLIGALGG